MIFLQTETVSEPLAPLFKGLQDFIFNILASIVDLIALFLPSTPDNVQFGYLYSQAVENINSSEFSYFLFQIGSGLVGILLIAAVYKFIKILPLT